MRPYFKAGSSFSFPLLVYHFTAQIYVSGLKNATVYDFTRKHTYKLLESLAENLAEMLLCSLSGLEKITLKIEKPWALTGHQFKRPHNVVNSLYLKPADLERLVKERFERYETIKKTEQRAEEYLVDDAEVVVVAYGASSRVARSAVNAARAEGIKAGLIRPITLWPFPTDALQRAAQHVKKFLAVEMSMGQMVDDVRLAIHDQKPVEFYGRTGGMIPTPAEVLGAVKKAGGVL